MASLDSARLVAQQQRATSGLVAGIAAFSLWGLLPLYWKQLESVASFEIMCHRILWSFIFLIPVVWMTGRWPEVREVLQNKKTLLRLGASGLLVASNWYVYIWAVNSGHILETSLGYYINPLLNVALGAIFLRERLSRVQCIAVGIAVFGVLVTVVGYGQFPWVALVLATSFSLYGFMRKTVNVGSISGLFIETVFLAPWVFLWLTWLWFHGEGSFGHSRIEVDALLMGAGVVTSMPLMWFAVAARSLRLTTLGLLQYVAPTLAFIQGVFLFHEPVTQGHLVTFSCIWLALVLYSLDSWRQMRRVETLEESA